MRILGFSLEWDKLQQEQFTSFRFHRKDRDWEVGEMVQVVFKPRSKGRKLLGVAEIIGKKEVRLQQVTNAEARADGFRNWVEMRDWLEGPYGVKRMWEEPMVKLTLRWRSGGSIHPGLQV